MNKNLAQFIEGYMVAAVWTAHETDGFPDVDLLADETKQALTAQATEFYNENYSLLDEYNRARVVEDDAPIWVCAGHDLWLTRNGHGAGFWDRGAGALGDQLTALVGHGTKYPQVEVYLGDDLKLYTI